MTTTPKQNFPLAWVAATLLAGLMASASEARRSVVEIATENPANVLALRPGGDQIAAAGQDRSLRVWDMSGALVAKVEIGDRWGVTHLTYTPDGEVLIQAGKSGQVIARDAQTLAVLNTYGEADWNAVHSVAVAPDSRSLAYDKNYGRPTTVDIETGRTLRVFGEEDETYPALAFSADGSMLAAAGPSPWTQIRVWEAASGGLIREVPTEAWVAKQLAFSPDGRLAVLAGNDLQVWDVKAGVKLGASRWGTDDFVAFDPASNLLLQANYDDLEVGRLLWEDLPNTPRADPNEDPLDRLRRASGAGPSIAVDLGPSERLDHDRERPLSAVAISAGGDRMAVAWRADPAITIYRSDDLRRRMLNEPHRVRRLAGVNRAADVLFTNDGRRILVADPSSRAIRGGLHVLRSTDGRLLRKIDVGGSAISLAVRGEVAAVGVLQDGSGAGRFIALVDLQQGRVFKRIDGKRRPDRLAFCDRGRVLASAVNDSTDETRFYDTATGRPIRETLPISNRPTPQIQRASSYRKLGFLLRTAVIATSPDSSLMAIGPIGVHEQLGGVWKRRVGVLSEHPAVIRNNSRTLELLMQPRVKYSEQSDRFKTSAIDASLAAISHDNQQLALIGNLDVSVFDTTTGHMTHNFKSPEYARDAAFLLDGRLVTVHDSMVVLGLDRQAAEFHVTGRSHGCIAANPKENRFVEAYYNKLYFWLPQPYAKVSVAHGQSAETAMTIAGVLTKMGWIGDATALEAHLAADGALSIAAPDAIVADLSFWKAFESRVRRPLAEAGLTGELDVEVCNERFVPQRRFTVSLPAIARESAKPVVEVSAVTEAESPAKSAPVAKSEPRLEGLWRAERVQQAGRLLTDAPAMRYRFRGGRLIVETPGQPSADLTFRADDSATPARLDIVLRMGGEKQLAKMIYRFIGDSLIVCYPPPGEARPTQFRAGPDDRTTLIRFVREE